MAVDSIFGEMITKMLECCKCGKQFSFQFPRIVFGKSSDTVEGMMEYISYLSFQRDYSYGQFLKHREDNGELTDHWICEGCEKKTLKYGVG